MVRTLSSIAAFALYLMASYDSFATSINAPNAKPSEDIVARGVLRSSQTANLTAPMSGRLLELPYKSGEYFKAGALLAKFDCALQEAQLTVLLKEHQTRKVKYDNAAELYKYGAAGKLDVTLAQFEMQQALAETDVMQVRLKYCTIYAPFSGYVTARHSSEYETPQIGQPLYSLQRARSLELSIISPSSWMKWLEKGKNFEFTIDETGEVFQASVIRIGVSVDPVSQTLEIIAKPNSTPKALTGMSGVAHFKSAQ